MKGLSSELHKIKLRPGDTHRLKLGGLGSAGYSWEYAIEGEAGIVSVLLDSLPPPSLPRKGNSAPDSFSIEFLLIITALKPGVVKVQSLLRRAWEKENPPLREVCVEVTVLS